MAKSGYFSRFLLIHFGRERISRGLRWLAQSMVRVVGAVDSAKRRKIAGGSSWVCDRRADARNIVRQLVGV